MIVQDRIRKDRIYKENSKGNTRRKGPGKKLWNGKLVKGKEIKKTKWMKVCKKGKS